MDFGCYGLWHGLGIGIGLIKRVSKNWQILPFRKSFRNTEILLNTETFLKKYFERTRGNYWKSKSEFYYKDQ